jgi:hypothetical protein
MFLFIPCSVLPMTMTVDPTAGAAGQQPGLLAREARDHPEAPGGRLLVLGRLARAELLLL